MTKRVTAAQPDNRIAIIGTVGVPGCYGGFETLAENLVRHADTQAADESLTVYCSARAYSDRPHRFYGARLRYSRFAANGPQSVIYDAVTALDAVIRGHNTLLVLGVSGAVILPLLRMVSQVRIVTNVDGIEWKREKWRGFKRTFLRWSERMAVRYSHAVIADNQGIADHLWQTYGMEAQVIAYGGDHALAQADVAPERDPRLPHGYALALCRIEPENNVEMILEAFDGVTKPLVFVGNWEHNDYGRSLRAQYAGRAGLYLLEPIYEPGPLYRLRAEASVYVHGHSAGGTNPSLVEMMHFGVPVLAYDCDFNRYSTESRATYFGSAAELSAVLAEELTNADGNAMREIACRRYRWEEIGHQYIALMCSGNHD